MASEWVVGGNARSIGARLAVVAVALAGLVPGGAVVAQTVVPVHEEPRHRLVLDRVPVRVLDVQIMPGDTTLYHRHDAPILYVRINTPVTNSQPLGQPWRPVRARPASERPSRGDVTVNVRYPQQPLSHRVTNVDTTVFHLIAVGNYGAGDTLAAAQQLAPPAGEVEIDNAYYRASRLRLAPGESTGWLRYSTPVVGVQPDAGRAQLTFRNGTVQELAAAGAWFFADAEAEYQLSNRGDADVVIVLTEVR